MAFRDDQKYNSVLNAFFRKNTAVTSMPAAGYNDFTGGRLSEREIMRRLDKTGKGSAVRMKDRNGKEVWRFNTGKKNGKLLYIEIACRRRRNDALLARRAAIRLMMKKEMQIKKLRSAARNGGGGETRHLYRVHEHEIQRTGFTASVTFEDRLKNYFLKHPGALPVKSANIVFSEMDPVSKNEFRMMKKNMTSSDLCSLFRRIQREAEKERVVIHTVSRTREYSRGMER